MKIITYSDLHLEFGHGWSLPDGLDADLLVLAGDIATFRDSWPFLNLLKDWQKPVLFVAGNHEYYTSEPMQRGENAFIKAITDFPHIHFLRDESVGIDGVHFFGGTMWTDFNDNNPLAMQHAAQGMNDFRLIRNEDFLAFRPEDSLILHENFKKNLLAWFEKDLSGTRIVISHHAPCINPNSQYKSSLLQPTFNSLDMIEIIEKYQPDYWIYGHTHECDDQMIGRTRIISNQLGYANGRGGYECANFDEGGKPIIV